MGYWTNDEGGLTGDRQTDIVGDIIKARFGSIYTPKGDLIKKKAEEVFNSIITDKTLFNEIFDKVKVDFFKIDTNTHRDMTPREFIGHMLFCLGSLLKLSDVQTPDFCTSQGA